jgi:hypothetical protein
MQWDHTPSVEEEALAKKLFEELDYFWEARTHYPIDSLEINELVEDFETLADMGNIDAMYWLGRLYHDSDLYESFDSKVASSWFEKAANLGHALAM